ncbi:hypothetical protein [Streptomyces melanogenes]|uniref:hypothetical protein n=1 Tax=Streptomyces melanogenes TaxID=67326 RepID=UPI00167E08C5|nr:hypothetical protein [Streptomyces melanogenes]GGP42315.1 hypothetical protein GCM10010278_19260 [Streptomyces melanogenes]
MASPSGTGHPAATRYGPLRIVGCALIVAAVSLGCDSGHRTASPATPVPAPTTTTPEEDCRRLVEYWARAMIQGNRWSGLDWEQKGFSIDQHEVHDRVVAAARVEQRTNGIAAALDLIARQSRQECVARHGAMGGGRH